MNRATVALLAAGVFLFFSVAASANDLVQFPKGTAAWTVTVAPDQNSSSATPAPAPQVHVAALTVTQDSEKRHTLVTWSNHQTEERWEMFRFNLLLTEDLVGHAYATGNGGPRAIPYGPHSFSWLKPKFLQEKDPVLYQGVPCFHYKGTVLKSILSGGNTEVPGSSAAEAWIDSTTLLPVALDDGTGLATYTFQKEPPPPLTLTLPSKYQNVYVRYKQGMGIFDSH